VEASSSWRWTHDLAGLCVPNAATAELDLSEAEPVVPTFEDLSIENVWAALRRR
jgi:hypothetical protein